MYISPTFKVGFFFSRCKWGGFIMFKKYVKGNKRGQAMVEIAILIPILITILMGIFEFGRIFNAHLILTHASREGARSAALSSSDTDIIQTVNESIFYLDTSNLTISIYPSQSSRSRGTKVTVELDYNIDIIAPFLEAIISDPFPLESKTVMRVE